MADNKKEQEREELHRAIWAIADELRGAVDGWDFKNYVLGTMFYRYISENLTNYINRGEQAAGNLDFDYARMSDVDAEEAREGLVEEKGFFILPSELFCNVRARASMDVNLNETLERVFRHIEESAKGSQSESSFAGLFDDFDVNSNKLGSTVARRNERLAKLLDGIALMRLGAVDEHDIDAFGDAYEYLMTMYASNAGKSGGEFFTPADVSELLTRLGTVGKKKINKVYDPACGSGSLLLKALKVLGKDAVVTGFFGQEINITTYNLCRINMFLHDVGFDKFDVACEDTLTNPQHWDDEPFELIVSNPPYSIKWPGNDNPLLINDPRFSPAGVLAPKSKADMAFIMHALSWLAPNGTAAIVCFPGIMYRGGAEKKIRKFLIDNNYIDCVIQLPDNLFFGTSIATCIMVLKKNKPDNQVLFIDASNEFVKVTNNNRLTYENIEKIVSCFTERTEEVYFSHVASYDEVMQNDYNLTVSRYVEPEDTREKIDISTLTERILLTIQDQNKLRAEISQIIEEVRTDKKNSLVSLIEKYCPDGVQYKALREVATVSRGGSFQKKDFLPAGIPCIHYGQIYTKYGLFADSTFTFISRECAQRQKFAKKNDIVMAVTSENIDDVCKCVGWLGEVDIAVSGHSAIIHHNQNPKYLVYYFHSEAFFAQKRMLAHGTKVIEVTPDKLLDLMVPLPPIEVQNEIVKILDAYTSSTDTLMTKLTEELEACKKQYEYYRDALFSFAAENEEVK